MVRHCPRCELRFVTEGELREHLAVDHGTRGETLERYRYPEGPGAQKPLYRDLTESPAGQPRRYLVVANQSLGGETLTNHIRELVAAGPASFYVVVPATRLGDYPAAARPVSDGGAGGDAERGAAQARWRLRQAVELFRSVGADVRGEVGPPDPLEAVGLALARQGTDEVIVSTLPSRMSRWLGSDVPGLIARRFRVPVTTVVQDASAAPQSR